MVKPYLLKREIIYNILKCPIKIPLNDLYAWEHFPKFNKVYNKIYISKSQNIPCAPFGLTPNTFPVIIKPITNLYGMGWDSKVARNKDEYYDDIKSGSFWMSFLKGDHLSIDFAILNGKIKWYCCFKGYPSKQGMFDYWETLPNYRISFYIYKWISIHLKNYTGCINIETIGGKIIECHLRMGDINQLHSLCLFKEIIKLYEKKEWSLKKLIIPKIYLVPIFVPYNTIINITHKEIIDICNIVDPNEEYIYTYQKDPPQTKSINPPGGVRIANINTICLKHGLDVRKKILILVKKKKIKRWITISVYIILICYIFYKSI